MLMIYKIVLHHLIDCPLLSHSSACFILQWKRKCKAATIPTLQTGTREGQGEGDVDNVKSVWFTRKDKPGMRFQRPSKHMEVGFGVAVFMDKTDGMGEFSRRRRQSLPAHHNKLKWLWEVLACLGALVLLTSAGAAAPDRTRSYVIDISNQPPLQSHNKLHPFLTLF